MTKLEKFYSIIENPKDVGVKLGKDVLRPRFAKEAQDQGKGPFLKIVISLHPDYDEVPSLATSTRKMSDPAAKK